MPNHKHIVLIAKNIGNMSIALLNRDADNRPYRGDNDGEDFVYLMKIDLKDVSSSLLPQIRGMSIVHTMLRGITIEQLQTNFPSVHTALHNSMVVSNGVMVEIQ